MYFQPCPKGYINVDGGIIANLELFPQNSRSLSVSIALDIHVRIDIERVLQTPNIMSAQPHHRGGRGEHRGGGGRGRGSREGGRGGGRGSYGGPGGGERERPKKENILDLGKYMDKKITVKFTGGREGMSASCVF